MPQIDNSDHELKYVILRDINGTPSSDPTSFLAAYRDINRAAVLIDELLDNSYLEIIESKIKVTPKGKELKKKLLNERISDKRNKYVSRYETILNEQETLKPAYRQLLSEARNRKCAALIIADAVTGDVGDLDWKLEICPGYKESCSETLYLLRKLETQAELNDYKYTNITEYEISALIKDDSCDKCRSMDGKIFPVSQAVIGENCPPFHEKCRCSIMAVLPTEEELEEEFEKFINDNVPERMEFDEWIDSLEPTKDGKLAPKKKKNSIFKKLFGKK